MSSPDAVVSDQYKLRAVTLLHMIGYNSDVPAADIGAELLFAIGAVLEGLPVESLELRHIDKGLLLKEMIHG